MHPLVLLSLLLQPAPLSIIPHLAKNQPPALPTREFVYAMHSKNIDGVLTLYSPDAVFTDPEGHTFNTPQALRSLYEQVFATYDSDLDFTRTSIKVKGDQNKAGTTVLEADNYHETLRTRKTNQVQEVCGQCIFTWVRTDDGRWLMTSQVWTEKSCPVATSH